MLIGLDLDNTIVCYDRVFARLASEAGLPENVVGSGKRAIRDYLREQDREDEWTVMQGKAYGARMNEAEAFEGALEFIAAASGEGHELCVVSHRTKQPFLGDPADLHASAFAWLRGREVEGKARIFLEETAAAKAARISGLGCEVFVDDLPEFLSRPDFPAKTRALHFCPGDRRETDGLETVASWTDIAKLLLGK